MSACVAYPERTKQEPHAHSRGTTRGGGFAREKSFIKTPRANAASPPGFELRALVGMARLVQPSTDHEHDRTSRISEGHQRMCWSKMFPRVLIQASHAPKMLVPS